VSILVALALAILAAAGAGGRQAAAAGTLYVAPSGSDSADCLTPATACASFDRAYHRAAPGQEVEMAGGIYPPQAFSPDSTKSSPDDVVFRPAAAAKVIVSCPGESNCVATEGADHLTVSGLSTQMLEPVAGMARQGGVALDRGSDDVTFLNVDAGHVFIAGANASVIGGDYGPTVDKVSLIPPDVGPNALIDGATFHDHLRNTGHMECISLYGAQGVTVRRTRFDTCSVFAIFATPEPDQDLRDVLIENNVFSNSGNTAMSAHVKIGSHGGACTNFLMRNNTFVDDNVISDCGITAGRATNLRWLGNIFESFDGGGDCGGHVFDYNVIERGSGCGPHDVVVGAGKAGFVDRAGGDLHLRAGSPAIGRGDPSDYPATDIDGNPRPFGSAPDAGADEYGSVGGTAPGGGAGQGAGGGGGGAGGGAGGLDRVAPGLTVRVARSALRRALRHRRLALRATCSEPCRLQAVLVASRSAVRRAGLGLRARPVGRAQRKLAAGVRTVVALPIIRRAALALRRLPRVRVTLRTTASDAAGNRRTVVRRLTLKG
jgi:hypothetical protein